MVTFTEMEDLKSYYYPRTSSSLEGLLQIADMLRMSEDERFMIDEFHHPIIEKEIEVANNILKEEYNSLCAKGLYFYGCPVSIYTVTYQNRLSSFLRDRPGSSEIDFLLDESEEGLLHLPQYFSLLNEDIIKPLKEGLQLRFQFLKNRISEGVTIKYLPKEDKFELLGEVIGYDINENYPNLFTTLSVFKAFKTYLSFIIRDVQEISFLKKSLEQHSLITSITDMDFIEFLWDNKYISSAEYSALRRNGQLSSLSKSSTASRSQLFDKVFSETLS